MNFSASSPPCWVFGNTPTGTQHITPSEPPEPWTVEELGPAPLHCHCRMTMAPCRVGCAPFASRAALKVSPHGSRRYGFTNIFLSFSPFGLAVCVLASWPRLKLLSQIFSFSAIEKEQKIKFLVMLDSRYRLKHRRLTDDLKRIGLLTTADPD